MIFQNWQLLEGRQQEQNPRLSSQAHLIFPACGFSRSVFSACQKDSPLLDLCFLWICWKQLPICMDKSQQEVCLNIILALSTLPKIIYLVSIVLKDPGSKTVWSLIIKKVFMIKTDTAFMFIIQCQARRSKGEKYGLLKKGITLRMNFVLWVLLTMYYEFFQTHRKMERLKQ